MKTKIYEKTDIKVPSKSLSGTKNSASLTAQAYAAIELRSARNLALIGWMQ